MDQFERAKLLDQIAGSVIRQASKCPIVLKDSLGQYLT